jgi:hypothetical protein
MFTAIRRASLLLEIDMRERLTVVHGARTRRERGRAIADDKSSSDSLTPHIPILGTILLGRIGLPAWTHREPGSRSPTQTTRAGAGLPLLQHHVRRLSLRQVNRILKLIPAGLAGPHISDTTVANDSFGFPPPWSRSFAEHATTIFFPHLVRDAPPNPAWPPCRR